MTKCSEIQNLLSAYIDGVLSQEDNDLVEAHLRLCKTCRRELAQLNDTIRLLHSLPDVPVPADFASRLNERLLDAVCEEESAAVVTPKKKWIQRIAKSPWFPLSVAAAIAFMVWVAVNPPVMKTRQSDIPAQENPASMAGVGGQSEAAADLALPLPEKDAAEEKSQVLSKENSFKPLEQMKRTAEAEETDKAEKAENAEKAEAEEVIEQKAAEQEIVVEKIDKRSTSARANDHKVAARTVVPDEEKEKNETESNSIMIQAFNEESLGEGKSPETLYANNERKVIHTADILLEVKEKSIQEVIAQVSASFNILSSNEESGKFTIRLPSTEVEKALSLFHEYGAVLEESYGDNDVSADYYGTLQRLDEFQARRADIMKIMDVSADIDEKVCLGVEMFYLDCEIKLMEERTVYLAEMSGCTLVEVTVKVVSP